MSLTIRRSTDVGTSVSEDSFVFNLKVVALEATIISVQLNDKYLTACRNNYCVSIIGTKSEIYLPNCACHDLERVYK